jgi:hypothetical protein
MLSIGRVLNQHFAASLTVLDIINRLPYAVDAPFNSRKQQHEALCHPKTRLGVLFEIRKWTTQQDQRSLFWVNGQAGTGKSTIARTVARHCRDEGTLGASFFFSRGGGDVGNAQKFVTSIARQLAYHVPFFGEHICGAIQQERDIANHSIADLWNRLIMQSLPKLQGTSCPPSLVIVIDALDECDNENDIVLILRLLAATQPDASIHLRFFLTSRPEVPVRRVFRRLPASGHEKFVLHEMLAETRSDLRAFFEDKLSEIADNHDLGADWPGQATIQRLVDRANGLFIWAATSCRFIDNGGKQFAGTRLTILLQAYESGNTPQDNLDHIYTTVFVSSIPVHYNFHEKSIAYAVLRYVLGSIVVLFSELSTYSMASLLGIEHQEAQGTLNDLHSILVIPDDPRHQVRLHHPSLRDYLLDDARCTNTDIFVHKQEAHRKLLICCIRLMSGSLRKDICGLGAPGTLLQDLPDDTIEQYIRPELQYACIYWVEHLLRSGYKPHDNDFIHHFFKTFLLHWLEVRSLVERLPSAILTLISLLSHVRVSMASFDSRLTLLS